MSRIDRLAENQLVARILSLQAAAKELRGSQIFGSDNFTPRLIQSGSAYDIQINTVGFNNRVVLVEFTPSSTTVPQSSLVYRFLMAMEYSTGTIVSATEKHEGIERQKPVDGVQRWYVYLSESDVSPVPWIRLKFYLFANGGGTFTATLV